MQYTTYYNLPQYEGSDKTAWLTVFNQAMLAIDTGIHGAKAAADSASTLATTANNAATQASSDVTSLTNSLNTVIGNINTINSLIGNGTPTTTDQTIIGAINEINANVGTLTTNQGNLSSLTTTDKSSLVAAINEVAQGSGGGGGGSSANELGTAVDLSTYTSFANAYTFPSEGYLYLNAPGDAGNIDAQVYGADATSASDPHFVVTSVISRSGNVYVRAGMKCFVNAYGGTSNVFNFIPLE